VPESPIRYTQHARRRAHQRAAQASVIELVLTHADTCVPVGSGCQCFSLSDRALEAIPATEWPPALRDRVRGLAVLTDAGGTTVITVLRPKGRRGRRYRHRFISRRAPSTGGSLH
jgi:hypothetical protein